MVQLNQVYHASQMPKEESSDVLPVGDYVASISKVELKDTKAGNGQILKVILKIIHGDFTGKVIFDQMNIVNPNSTAVEIGLKRLNSYITCAGLQTFSDTDQLIGVNVLASIIIKEDSYGKKNEVKIIKNPNEMKMQPQQAQPRPPFQVQQPIQAQQPIAQQQTWQQPQQQAQPMQWGQPQAQPKAPTIQSTQDMLNDEIPF